MNAENFRQRPLNIARSQVEIRPDLDGGWRLSNPEPLKPYPDRITDCLVRGALEFPERVLVARRGPDGAWIRLSYADMLRRARAIGQALLDRGLSAEKPLLILSGNDLEHLQMALGAMYAGVPYCPISPAYSLVSSDHARLDHIVKLMTPGMVYASDGPAFARAIKAVVPANVEVCFARGQMEGRASTPLAELLTTQPTQVGEVHRSLGPDTIAKFLFTSGSTKLPKAVTTTHRMLCANMQQSLQTFPFFAEEPPVIVDWLPWNHTFGGTHNVNMALYNGGSYYIDDGKPSPQGFAETVRNLTDIAPTVYFNVPKGWEMLAEALEHDDALAANFLSRVKMFFFAGAGLSQAAWDRLDRVCVQRCGETIRMMTGLGMTETAPSDTFATGPLSHAGYVGLPVPGCEVRLAPVEGKLEARFRGPHVMPGYWRSPEQTREAFDADGFYQTGDALCFADPAHPEYGLQFDGRIAEDFKLTTGTFVSVGPLRARVISAGAPYILDVVITGINRDDIGLMVFPRMEHMGRLSGLGEGAPPAAMLASEAVRGFFAKLLEALNRQSTGSASRVARLLLLAEPPSVDGNEFTDKGSVNQRAVLTRRATLVEALYSDNDPTVILA